MTRVTLPLKTVYSIVFAFILFVGAFLRLADLGTAPAGITWDEAALGYIGKMVVTTGADEHLDRWPLVFQSFGDYKAPLAMYITGVSTTLFGLNAWATRLPFALAGVASIALITALAWYVWQKPWYAFAVGWMLAITPWHLLFSRIAFESGIAFMTFIGFLLGWRMYRSEEKIKQHLGLALFVLNFAAGLYVYHSTKIVFPLALLWITFLELRYPLEFWRKNLRNTVGGVLALVVLLLPFALSLAGGTALNRASQTTIFSAMSGTTLFTTFFTNLAVYFSWEFLVGGATTTLRHGTGYLGVLYFTQYVLFLMGVFLAILSLFARKAKQSWHKAFISKFKSWFSHHASAPTIPTWWWLGLLCITYLPAAIGVETPHANRALLALVPVLFLIGETLQQLEVELKPQWFATAAASIFLIMSLEWGNFWMYYQGTYQKTSSTEWLEGYEEAVNFVEKYQKNGEKIKFTASYGEPDIFFGFYQDIDAQTYRTQRVPNVTFGTVTSFDQSKYDVLVTGSETPLNIPPVHEVLRKDGSTAFRIYETF